LQASAKPIDRPSHNHVEFPARRSPAQRPTRIYIRARAQLDFVFGEVLVVTCLGPEWFDPRAPTFARAHNLILRKIAEQFGVDPGTVQRISRPFETGELVA
jgi:hypothetical protein